MTLKNMIEEHNFTIICQGDDNIDISGIYCGDLLSMVMGRAKENQVWITVMANINAIAVAVLTDVSVVVLSEGCVLDDASKKRAEIENLWVLSTSLPTYETAMIVSKYLC